MNSKRSAVFLGASSRSLVESAKWIVHGPGILDSSRSLAQRHQFVLFIFATDLGFAASCSSRVGLERV